MVLTRRYILKGFIVAPIVMAIDRLELPLVRTRAVLLDDGTIVLPPIGELALMRARFGQGWDRSRERHQGLSICERAGFAFPTSSA